MKPKPWRRQHPTYRRITRRRCRGYFGRRTRAICSPLKHHFVQARS